VLAANPATLPLTARFKKFFAQRTLAESTLKEPANRRRLRHY